jgi:uncharacterized membrane protein YfcA
VPTVLVLVAGVGVLMLPLMVLGLGIRTKAAVSTSPIVALATGVVGGAGYVMARFGRLAELLPLIVGSVVGAWAGVRLRAPLPDGAIRLGFAGFMAVVALRILGDAASIL